MIMKTTKFRASGSAIIVGLATALSTLPIQAKALNAGLSIEAPKQQVRTNDGRIVVAQNSAVNGHNVNTVSYPGGIFAQRSRRNWTETNGDGTFHFKETGRDDWSVYLYDASRNTEIQLDLHRKQILFSARGKRKKPLYRISSSTAKATSRPRPVRNNSCQTLGNQISRNSNRPVTVKFVNRSGEFRSVMWIDFKGQPTHYADLNPGQSFTINTFVTHPWMFTDGPGNCIEMFMPKRGSRTFNIKARSPGFGPE
ncbi:VHL beta domain-containing protein [Cohaesibacter celericrescens]|uniref:VHL beta domain-containing protein n=1 Tax=Cohaesibacter celericrescens TaxID=2067669 RepID=UPI003562BD6A